LGVPILLAGPAAEEAARRLNAIGMSCEAIGAEIGQAAAVKMIRSVVVKGIEALLIESLTAAERAGVAERVLDSVARTLPGTDWRAAATYFIGRTRAHGARRVTELNEAADALRELGIEPLMARAIAATIGHAHGALAAAGATPAADYRSLVAALAAAGEESKRRRG
jgi:3-hydroxyisobutyrate dehydrogenase-like beta-hydroxyacid dehydrogenase